MPVNSAKKLWHRISGQSNTNTVNVVAQRFLQAFLDHGVQAAQIPRLLPIIKLDDLKSDDALLSVLTPELLDHAARMFGIRSQWLEGVDDEIYEYKSCYKQPELFFELFTEVQNRVDYDFSYFPLRVLVCTKKLDGADDREQLLVPVLVEKIATLGDEWIYRFHIFNDGFNWSHPPCRIQLKAMVKVIYAELNTPIPLFVISSAELQSILERRKVPSEVVNRSLLTNPSLEDFTITSSEASIDEAVEDLEVDVYIHEHNLKSQITKKPFLPHLQEEHIAESEESHVPVAPVATPSQSGKRAINDREVWAPVESIVKALWSENDSLLIGDAVKRIQLMTHLKASNKSSSTIHKRIAKFAPPKVRGKSGRKSK
jgi:hypothetical protein